MPQKLKQIKFFQSNVQIPMIIGWNGIDIAKDNVEIKEKNMY